MKYKKTIISSTIVALSIGTGVTLAANQPSNQLAHTVQSTVVTHTKDAQGGDIQVTTTTPDVVATPVKPTPTADATVAKPDPTVEAAPTLTALQQFNATLTSQAQSFGNYFVPVYAPDLDTFVANQLRCSNRGVDDSTPQATLDGKATFLGLHTDANGKSYYQFFDGGCRVLQITR